MVFTVQFSELVAVMLEGITGFIYNFLPGFFVLLFIILPGIVVYKVIKRGMDLAKKPDF